MKQVPTSFKPDGQQPTEVQGNLLSPGPETSSPETGSRGEPLKVASPTRLPKNEPIIQNSMIPGSQPQNEVEQRKMPLN